MGLVETDLRDYERDQMIAEREYESEYRMAEKECREEIEREWENRTLRVSYEEAMTAGSLLTTEQWLILAQKALKDIQTTEGRSDYFQRANDTDKECAEYRRSVSMDSPLDNIRELMNLVTDGEPTVTFLMSDIREMAMQEDPFGVRSSALFKVWQAAEQNILPEMMIERGFTEQP